MSGVVVSVENLSKQYRLGQVGTGTMTHDLNRFWHKVRGKEDPYLRVGGTNDRTSKTDDDYVWALKDVNFEVKQGELLGVIGKNGAGKSTLLKLLSRITSPSTGSIKVKGRIAALLEVGTGFHPDLTGRENIFLNGAILGMVKRDIRNKLDEIVDFSGCAKYVDTPVKRYSSGMLVRLGFAVAAHLEPEILVVDEVLAVGDAEFQKKCIGKMKAVSGEGRTVIFVSHNMPSIRALCQKVTLLENGGIKFVGNVEKGIGMYLSDNLDSSFENDGRIPKKLSLYNTGEAKFQKAFLVGENGNRTTSLAFREVFKVVLEFEVYKFIENVNITLGVVSTYGETILFTVSKDEAYSRSSFDVGSYQVVIDIDEYLMPREYRLNFGLHFFNTGSSIDFIEIFYPFEVRKEIISNSFEYPWETVHGYVESKNKWEIKSLDHEISR